MPLKWKIYYACSLYVPLWSVIMIVLLFFKPLVNDADPGNMNFTIFFCSMLFVLVLKSILSVKSVTYYKKSARPAKAEKILFIIGFCLNIFITAIIVTTAVFISQDLVKYGESVSKDIKDYVGQLIYYISFLVTTICCIYFCIFDLILLKAIRKKYYGSMLNIGEDIIDNP